MPKFKATAIYITTGMLLLQQALAFAAPVNMSLEESVAYALRNNPAIQIANEDLKQSKWGVSEAKGGKLPSLSLGSSYNFQGSSNQDGDFNNSLRMNWQLYTGGRTDAQVKQAELGATSATLNVEKEKQQLKLDTTSAYYNVLQAKNIVAVNQQTVDSLKAHLNIVQAKYDAGAVAKSDLLRAQVELANAEQNLIKAQNDYELAKVYLLNIMNMDPNTDLELQGDLTYQQDNRTLEDAINYAKAHRPEMEQAKIAIDSAEAGIKIAESNNLPSVGLSASTGWKDSLLPSDNNWSVGLSASWDIFDGGVNKAKINQAEASLDKAKLQTEQTADSIEREVRQSYLSMKEAEKRLSSTQTAVDQANEDLYIATEKYKAGVGTNLDVMDAQLALTQAKTNHVQALYDYNVNKAKLDKAVGVNVD